MGRDCNQRSFRTTLFATIGTAGTGLFATETAISGAGLQSSGPGPHYLPVTMTRSDGQSGQSHAVAKIAGPDRIELIGK